MTPAELLLLLIIGGLCGAAAQSLLGYSRGGCMGSIAVGIVGSVVGTWLARSAGLPTFLAVDIGGTPFPIVWSILGSVIFVAALAVLSRVIRS